MRSIAAPDTRRRDRRRIRPARAAGTRRIHLHLDLDVLDAQLVGPANSYAMADGLTVDQAKQLLHRLAREFELASASVASYDPEVDSSGPVPAAALDLVALLAEA